MREFLENVSRYPRYLISLIVWFFLAIAETFRPLFKNPVTAIATVGMLGGTFALLFFTLRAMLGLTS